MSTGGGGNNGVEKSPLLSSSLSERLRTVRMEGAPQPAATTMNRNVADMASAVLELEEDDHHGGPSSLGASTTQQQSHSINSSHQKNAKKMPASAEAYQVCDI
jgi:hypothetical protein